MNEKRTFGEFITANKGKIIKGGIIVVGVVAGIIIVKKLTADGAEEIVDGALEFAENGFNNVTDGVKDIATTIVE